MVSTSNSSVRNIKKVFIHGVVAIVALTGVQLAFPKDTAEAARMYVPTSNRCYERKRPLFFNHVYHEVRCFKDYHSLANSLGQRDYWYTHSGCVENVTTGRHSNCYWWGGLRHTL